MPAEDCSVPIHTRFTTVYVPRVECVLRRTMCSAGTPERSAAFVVHAVPFRRSFCDPDFTHRRNGSAVTRPRCKWHTARMELRVDNANEAFRESSRADSGSRLSGDRRSRVASREAPNVSHPKIRILGLIGKISVKVEKKLVEERPLTQDELRGGLFKVKARAYWDSMGVFPLSIAAFGITALIIKLAKVKQGQWDDSDNAMNRKPTHESIVTTEEQEAELHVFKCGGCGYEMYPARGREFKHFPDSFKCLVCGTPKSEFWDLNDPGDPRNQTDDEDDENLDDEVGEEKGDDPSSNPDLGATPSAPGMESRPAE